jgi:isopenicillin N synthase-like dioxygenase
MLVYQPPLAPKNIPVVDLTPSFSGDMARIDSVAAAIHRACREMGFFYVSHHGIDQSLIEDTFEYSARFFSLPTEAKRALNMKNSPTVAGYECGDQQLDSQTAGAEKAPPDLKESFAFGMELPASHLLSQKRIRNYGHNQWPELPRFQETMLRYQGEVRKLGDHLLGLLARSLDLPLDWFVSHYQMCSQSVRLLKYPPQPQNAAFNQIGAGAHTDWGGVTVLAQDSLGGLEVRNANGDWVQATPIPNTFVINLGDLMARWTNGIYNANMHRVRNNRSDRDRYSIVSFNSPRPEVVIEPMPGCITEDFPRKFPTCTAQEHVNEMFRRSYGYSPGQTAAVA